MTASAAIAIVDIGKTNAKMLVVETAGGGIVWSAERQNISLQGIPVRQLDVRGLEEWLVEQLAAAPQRRLIQAIVPIAHGAAAVLLDGKGRVLLAPDYEDPLFETVAADYRGQRDSYRETFSPTLPLGLNLGRQLFFLDTRYPDIFTRCAHLLLYPQYWAWRLCGVMASEITSLGCHSDLWHVTDARFSDLAIRREWDRKFPPRRMASDSLGTIHADLAQRTELDPACRVLCGIHDSNASYLCHLIEHPGDTPFCVVSSGTWTVVMAHARGQADLGRLCAGYDMLANIDAFGAPVATARFMAGREFAIIAGTDGLRATPGADDLLALIARGAMALPAFSTAGGPFAGHAGRLLAAEQLSSAERAALATIYVALMTDLLLDLLAAAGDIIVDGPLAANLLYCGVLAALRPRQRVRRPETRPAPVSAALYLAGIHRDAVPAPAATLPLSLPQLLTYRRAWRAHLPAIATGAA